jgi:hypothetical protein
MDPERYVVGCRTMVVFLYLVHGARAWYERGGEHWYEEVVVE